MARLTDLIEETIKRMIEQNDGIVEITRSRLAEMVNCVPSQITYVLSTRFTNGQGYLVESRRGGGGWIRVQRVELGTGTDYLMHALHSIGNELSQHEAEIYIVNFIDYGIVSESDARLLRAALSDNALSRVDVERRAEVRMDIFKNMLTSLFLR
ncbi:MAG: CtsR family transcriptional regulator [Clostridia bacterium]|nr:CtsR family transcriptional regulator [Clostridia bacterium]